MLVTYLKIYSHIAGSFLLFCPLLLAPQNIQTSRIFQSAILLLFDINILYRLASKQRKNTCKAVCTDIIGHLPWSFDKFKMFQIERRRKYSCRSVKNARNICYSVWVNIMNSRSIGKIEAHFTKNDAPINTWNSCLP